MPPTFRANKFTGGATKVYSFYDYGGPDSNSILQKSNRASLSLQDAGSYLDSLSKLKNQKEYEAVAGTDITSILYPFVTKQSHESGVLMPSFASGINPYVPILAQDALEGDTGPSGTGYGIDSRSLLPYQWNYNEQDSLLDRFSSATPSGDSMADTISSEYPYGTMFDRLRDTHNTRSIGFRLPAMGVGWGFGAKHGRPFPSGTNDRTEFRGDVKQGWEVDPRDYIAAPIELAYDEDRHVWTAPRGFWAEITGVSGYYTGTTPEVGAVYSWVEKTYETTAGLVEVVDKTHAKSGGFLADPAFEINGHEGIASGTIVWMTKYDRNDCYVFSCGLTDEVEANRYELASPEVTWKADITDWEDGQSYKAGQLVKDKLTTKTYTADSDHTSAGGNRPNQGGSPWTEVFKRGVKFNVRAIDPNGTEFNTPVSFDSHGHLVNIGPQSLAPSGSYCESVLSDVTLNWDPSGCTITLTKTYVDVARCI